MFYSALDANNQEVAIKVSNLNNHDGSMNMQLVSEAKLMKKVSEDNDRVARVLRILSKLTLMGFLMLPEKGGLILSSAISR